MINSFWNICSTCPMPREEKLNSEYKRNYVWHPLAQDVISCAPQSVNKELGIQRKKQYPELAYRNHEVIRHDLPHNAKDVGDSRARSEERDFGCGNKTGPRSRSADPGLGRQFQKQVMVQSFPPITSGRVSTLPKTDELTDACEQVCELTEYKSKFGWPPRTEDNTPCFARKSVSMGVIKGSADAVDSSVPKSKLAPVHRPCTLQKDALLTENKPPDRKKKAKTEYNAKYKPFTSYVYVDGQWKKTSRLMKVPEIRDEMNEEPWFVEVTERLQKASEYRWRGQGHPVYGDLLPGIYSKPQEVPLQRPEKLILNHPKCHKKPERKEESKKKEIHSEPVSERKHDVKKQTTRRPKSAEPVKSKEVVKYKRPATTPPARLNVHHSLPPKKRMPKLDEVEKVPKTKGPRKTKEAASRPPSSSAGKKPSQAPSGKAWLQAGQYVPVTTGSAQLPAKKSSDAVRPSSLVPVSSATAAKSEPPSAANHHELPTASVKGSDNSKEEAQPTSEPSVVPLTHVKTPEEMTGMKSPEPENWTVPLENSERLQWSGTSTTDAPLRLKSPEALKEPISKISTTNDPVSTSAVPSEEPKRSSAESGKSSSTNVLDRARSRLDQFWSKHK